MLAWQAGARATEAAQDEGALALAAMAGRRLVAAGTWAPRLLRLPVLARAGLSDAALALVAAVHGQGAAGI